MYWSIVLSLSSLSDCLNVKIKALWSFEVLSPSDTPSYPGRVNLQQHHCEHLILCRWVDVLSGVECEICCLLRCHPMQFVKYVHVQYFKLIVTTSSEFIETSAELHGDLKCMQWLEIWISWCPYLCNLPTLTVLHIHVLAWPVHLECHRRCGHWRWLLPYMCVLYE
jgi:hypothetical protein